MLHARNQAVRAPYSDGEAVNQAPMSAKDIGNTPRVTTKCIVLVPSCQHERRTEIVAVTRLKMTMVVLRTMFASTYSYELT